MDESEIIIALERAALERWGKGDPSGFLEISAPDVVYFDPYIARRINGWEALSKYYQPAFGQIKLDRFELIDPLVQLHGDLAVLTFNYISWSGDGQARWNCTEVYRRTNATWQIIQTHWSKTQPFSTG